MNGATSGNFEMPPWIIGAVGINTAVTRVDLFDNGSASSSEAIYLFGSGGLDGLQILGNSTLVIGNIPIYALIDGVFENLHDRFGPGDTIIPFTTGSGTNNGFLAISGVVIPVPPAVGLGLVGLLAVRLRTVWRRRVK